MYLYFILSMMPMHQLAICFHFSVLHGVFVTKTKKKNKKRKKWENLFFTVHVWKDAHRECRNDFSFSSPIRPVFSFIACQGEYYYYDYSTRKGISRLSFQPLGIGKKWKQYRWDRKKIDFDNWPAICVQASPYFPCRGIPKTTPNTKLHSYFTLPVILGKLNNRT